MLDQQFMREIELLKDEVERLKTLDIQANHLTAISTFQHIPGLIAFWPFSSKRGNGDAVDMSGQGHEMFYHGTPLYGIENQIVQSAGFNGTTDFFRHNNESSTRITGLEATNDINIRGLTMGGYFFFDNVTQTAGIISKQDAALSYLLQLTGGGVQFIIDDGTGNISSGLVPVALGQWYFIVCKFTPSSELKIFLNDISTTNITAIPASIQTNTARILIGLQAEPSTNFLAGRAAMVFLSNNAVPDSIITNLFEQSRELFMI